MKTISTIRLALAVVSFVMPVMFFSSCEKNDPEPAVEKPNELSDVAKAFIERYNSDRRIVLPSKMVASDDFNAQITVVYAQFYNFLPDSIFTFLDDLPEEEAILSTMAINAASGTFDVYTWTDATTGSGAVNFNKLAFQVGENFSGNSFDIFVKAAPSDTEWIQLFHAEENSDGSESVMTYYLPNDDNATSFATHTYTWTGNNLVAVLELSDAEYPSEKSEWTLQYNKADKSGNLKAYYLNADTIQIDAEWDAEGNGIFRFTPIDYQYDGDGDISGYLIGEMTESSWTV